MAFTIIKGEYLYNDGFNHHYFKKDFISLMVINIIISH